MQANKQDKLSTSADSYDKVNAISPANFLLKWCRCERKSSAAAGMHLWWTKNSNILSHLGKSFTLTVKTVKASILCSMQVGSFNIILAHHNICAHEVLFTQCFSKCAKPSFKSCSINNKKEKKNVFESNSNIFHYNNSKLKWQFCPSSLLRTT